MKSIFTSFVNRPNSKSTDPSDCFLGRSIPSYVVFIAVFLTYYIVFQSFYNFIESKDPWPYNNFTDFVISAIVNMVPTLISFGYNYAIVFPPSGMAKTMEGDMLSDTGRLNPPLQWLRNP